MPSVNLDTKLKTITGDILQSLDKDGKTQIDATFKDVLSGLLSNFVETDDAVRTFRIALRIADNCKELDEDDIDYLIKQVKKVKSPPVIKGQLIIFLEDAKLKASKKD